MDKVSAVQIRTKFGFEFAPINKNVTELINIEQGSVGYGETTILSDIRMRILAGQRIGLLGRNGEGKSTLIKLNTCEKMEPSRLAWRRQLCLFWRKLEKPWQFRSSDTRRPS